MVTFQHFGRVASEQSRFSRSVRLIFCRFVWLERICWDLQKKHRTLFQSTWEKMTAMLLADEACRMHLPVPTPWCLLWHLTCVCSDGILSVLHCWPLGPMRRNILVMHPAWATSSLLSCSSTYADAPRPHSQFNWFVRKFSRYDLS